MAHYNVVSITKDEIVEQKIKAISKEFNYTSEIFSDMENIPEGTTASFVVLSIDAVKFKTFDPKVVMSKVQEAKFYFADSYLVVLVDALLDEETVSFLKKSGANLVMQKQELQTNSKLEFVSIQIIYSTYIPIKSADLKTNTKIDFCVYHLMPQNKKFIKAVYPGWEISESKKQRLDKENELYVHRDEVELFAQYVNMYQDKTAQGLNSRCRAYYVSLQKNFLDLILLLTDQVESVSFQKGKDNLEKCKLACENLLNALGSVNSPWEIVNNSVYGGFGTVERTPAIIASVGISALIMGWKDINDILLATLISDIGFVSMPYAVSKKVRDQDFSSLTGEELEWYQTHPLVGLNLALNKKLPISDKVKNIILNTHERADKTGFPKKIMPEKIPQEAQLIQFTQLLDDRCVTRMGEAKKHLEVEKLQFMNELEGAGVFNYTFLQEIKKSVA